MFGRDLNAASIRGRNVRRGAEHPQMPRAAVTIDEQDLERALLRKSVGRSPTDRHHCADCGRTPLVGETLYRYAEGR